MFNYIGPISLIYISMMLKLVLVIFGFVTFYNWTKKRKKSEKGKEKKLRHKEVVDC